MAVSDAYLTYSGGAIKRTARDRHRWDNIWLLPSATFTGTYTDLSVLGTGSYQHTIDYINLWREANRLQKKLGLKGREKFTSRFDYGSPFYSRTVTNSLPKTLSVKRVNSSGSTLDSWTGFSWPHPDPRGIALDLGAYTFVQAGTGDTNCPDRDTLFALGSSGIAETLPSVPQVSISQTIGELREGLPQLMSSHIASQQGGLLHQVLGGAGDAYINNVFAMQPLIRDFQAYVSTSKNYEAYTEQFHRNEGRLVRRARKIGSGQSVNSSSTLSSAPPTPAEGGSRHWLSGTRKLITESKSDVWFSASYKIALPKMDRNQFDDIKDWMNTYGVDPTPMTAWNLTPWSWLCDWIVSFDDLINNVSYLGRRGVSLHYAYVMCQTDITKRWTYDGQYRPVYNSSIGGGPTYPISLTAEQTTVTKQRVKASPLGFGVVGKDLTDDQKGILTALGLSRFF